jgi:hypothetical protein
VGRFVEWLLTVLRVERHDIGRVGDVYLTRWVLLGTRYGPGHKVFLHLFRRSDSAEALHNHPFAFWSLVLWPGYYEHTPSGRRWHGPLSLLRRPAAWFHRVELAPGRGCWTLVWAGERVQSWGFACPNGFVPWREFVAREESGGAGCE